MTIESSTYISQLNPAYPALGDVVSEGDDHIRKIKANLQATFPNLTAAAVTPTTNDLNTVTGAATTGATGFNVVTQSASSNTTLAASTAQVQAAILASSGITAALPAQTGNAGKVLQTDGTAANWQWVWSWVVKTANYTAVSGDAVMCNTTGGAFTITLPASPSASHVVRIADYAGTFATNNLTVGRNALKIMGLAEDMTISTNNASVTLTYIDSTQGWRLT